MKRKKRRTIIILSVIVTLFLGVFIYNRVLLHEEKSVMEPLGNIVSVNGHDISVYTEGTGPKTLVFMSGGGTCSPILDFKSLFKCLSDEYRIVVVERPGYGFSQSINTSRDISSILNDTRGALQQLGIPGPYILCPHSMSGIEAIYWSQKFPKEVEGVIGLDMATPYHYENLNIHMPILYLSKLGMELGFSRLIPNLWQGDAVKHGTLSDREKEIYHGIFYRKSLSTPMIKEAKAVKDNASYVLSKGIPQIPLLMFVSNGEGTGMKKELWKKCSETFVEQIHNGKIINLDCPHYIHDYCYNEISEEMKIFIGAL